QALEQRLSRIDEELTGLAHKRRDIRRQLDAAKAAARGHHAAKELADKAEAFEQARRELPLLKQARAQAGERWTALDQAHRKAVLRQSKASEDYDRLQRSLNDSERNAQSGERELRERLQGLRERSAASRQTRRRLPARWIAPETLDALHEQYVNATQARLRADMVQHEL